MDQVRKGLHDLWMVVRRRARGQVQHRIHALYLESCSHAWTRRRRYFTKRQNAFDMELMGAHWYRMEPL